MRRLVERAGVGRLLPVVTVAFVLCLALLGVLLYRIATAPPPVDDSAASESAMSEGGAAFGEFTPLAAPRPAPPVHFTDQSGKTVALADFRGKVVLINLWATWCAPCIKEMPSLAKLQTALPGLRVLAVSEDREGETAVAPFLAKLHLAGLAVYLDPQNDVTHAFAVDGLPTSFLIGGDGRIEGKLEGAADWGSAKMLALVRSYVASPAR